MKILIFALYTIREQWRTGDRATAVAIAMLPAWLLLSVAVLWVGGTIELALGIPGSSGAGTMIGVISLLLAGAILFGGPIWSLRRLGKALPDRERTVGEAVARVVADDVRFDGYVRVRGVNLGKPDNVAGCATFLVAVGTFLACAALVFIASAVYEAFGGISPEVVRGIGEWVFWLGIVFLFGSPLVVVLLARPRIRRWLDRQAVE